MPVRIISDVPGSTPRGEGTDSSSNKLRKGKWLVGSAVACAVALAGGLVWSGTQRDSATVSPTPTASESPWPAAPGSAAAAEPGAADVPGVPGLQLGTAAVSRGNLGGSLQGIPVGWPQTMDGAVSAAMVYGGAVYQAPSYVDSTYKSVQGRLYTAEGLKDSALTPTIIKQIRTHYRVNEKGQVVMGGKVSPKETFYADSYPRYGAYKVLEHQGSDDQPTLVVVDVWMPYVMGPGTTAKLDEVYVGWMRSKVEVKWEQGDWRINGTRASRTFPAPSDARRTNQLYQVRRDLLGTGWSVLADSSEQPLHGTVLTK